MQEMQCTLRKRRGGASPRLSPFFTFNNNALYIFQLKAIFLNYATDLQIKKIYNVKYCQMDPIINFYLFASIPQPIYELKY